MGPLLILIPFGLKVTGHIAEGNGFGFQVIGRDAQDRMPIGCPAAGNREETVGFGFQGGGYTDKLKVESGNFQ